MICHRSKFLYQMGPRIDLCGTPANIISQILLLRMPHFVALVVAMVRGVVCHLVHTLVSHGGQGLNPEVHQ